MSGIEKAGGGGVSAEEVGEFSGGDGEVVEAGGEAIGSDEQYRRSLLLSL